MKKILFVASTLSHIENFHIPYLKYFREQGYLVHVMGKTNNKPTIEYADKIIPISFKKNMFSLENFFIALKIGKIIKSENYDIVSIHTTLAAFFTRLGIIISLNKPKLVINTVHGYLFDDKSPFLKRLIMLSAEKITKCVTDTIIVMNSFDYDIAKKHKLYKNNLYLINGMGIKSDSFPSISYNDKNLLRNHNKFSNHDFILIYVAEFSKRKNHKFILDSINNLVKSGLKDIKLILLGDGKLLSKSKIYAESLDITDNVIFLGYKIDTCTYYQMSDICVSSSRSEGLPFNIMEAMSIGLPIIASKVKGHTDLVIPNENGFLFEYNSIDEFCKYIKILYKDKELKNNMIIKSKELSRNYSLDAVFENTINIILNEYKKNI